MSKNAVDLYSDTKTRPTPAMRQAMAAAEVGDEQSGDDPTTNRLCETVAELLGKEAAVFLPSGTMCNEIALAVHCRPSEEVIAHRSAHVINFEGGGPGAIAGVMIQALDGDYGFFSGDDLAAAIRPKSRYAPISRLLAVEQTSNLGGGTVWPLAQLQEVAAVAREHGLAVHMDGARLLNAVVASGVAAKDYAAVTDTVWVDFSKGLGCPVGAVLAGSRAQIDEAWLWKQRIGGAMRQSGILAAAALHALDHHVERMAEDHANARTLAEGLAGIPGVAVDLASVQTNIVYFDVGESSLTAPALSESLAGRGIKIGAFSNTRLRAVTHLDVDASGIERAVQEVAAVMSHA